MREIPVDLLELSPLRNAGQFPRPSRQQVALVRRVGNVDPVVARPLGDGRFEILRNAEAWLAAQLAGRDTVRVDVRDDLDAAAAGDLVRSIPTTGREVLDEAREFEGLVGVPPRRGEITRVAALAGRSRPYVSHALRLLRLPGDILKMVGRDELSAGHARALVALDSAARQRAFARRCVRAGWSVRELEAQVRHAREGEDLNAEPVASAKSPDVERLEREVSEHVGVRVTVTNRDITFAYDGNFEVLDGLLLRLGYGEPA